MFSITADFSCKRSHQDAKNDYYNFRMTPEQMTRKRSDEGRQDLSQTDYESGDSLPVCLNVSTMMLV